MSPRLRRLQAPLALALGTGLLTLLGGPLPAHAADVSCTGSSPNSFSCTGPSPVRLPGSTFELDFSRIIQPTPGVSFSTAFLDPLDSGNRLIQVQIAASGGTPGGSISFSNLAISIKSTTAAAVNVPIWQLAPEGGSTGVLAYTPSVSAPPNFSLAALTLKPDSSTFLNFPLVFASDYLAKAGISFTDPSSFSSFKLTGTFVGITSPRTTSVGFSLITSNLNDDPDVQTFGTSLNFAEVPVPLPAAGAMAAFGWSRRLRRRLRAAAATPAS